LGQFFCNFTEKDTHFYASIKFSVVFVLLTRPEDINKMYIVYIAQYKKAYSYWEYKTSLFIFNVVFRQFFF